MDAFGIPAPTEIDDSNDYAHYRLYVNLAALAIAVYGMATFFRGLSPESRPVP